MPNGPGAAVLEKQQDLVRGMLRITRHPFLWGAAIWARGHIIVNGDIASLILFGSLLILALIGSVLIDAKRLRKMGESYRAFMAQTSNVAFAAILAGRRTLTLSEIGWRRDRSTQGKDHPWLLDGILLHGQKHRSA